MNPERIPSWLLRLLAFPYGAAVRLRASFYQAGMLRQRRLDGVVISVGNLTVGGTGKTPMVLWLAERLAAEGKPVAILTRGYRGKKSAEGKTSDEAQLLRARLGDRAEVGVGADRFASGRDLEKRGARWFVLDDGFQHMQLARDVDIVLVDATNPFGGRLLPAGRRREPRSALGRADVIVIMRSSNAPAVDAAIRRDSNAPMFYARPELRTIRRLDGEGSGGVDQDVDSAAVRGRKLFAFCGIGNPAAFVADLHRWGLLVAGQRFFRDHHRYAQGDMDALVAEAKEAGANALVCTEKDTFNLGGVRCDAMEVVYCAISLCVDRSDEFWRTVMAIADKKRVSHENQR
ncbi:MAG: tetraacyldisaccharide 4'-kinase [Candidatus Acidiferrales bacterium]